MTSSPGLFALALSRLLVFLPRSWVRWTGSLLGVFWFDVLRLRRKTMIEHLDIAFPEKDRAWKTRTARRSLRNFTAGFAEFFALPAIDDAWVERNARIEGMEHLVEAKKKNKGVYLLSLHMGSYDVAASLMPMRGHETVLITKFFKNKRLNDLWFSIRGARGMKFIEPHGEKTAFDILKAIKRNAGVIFVLDQFMGKPYGIATRFFGRETGTAYGLALFVLKTGSPVVPVYSVQGGDGRLRLIFEPEIPVSSLISDDKDESIRRLTQKFNDVIESIVRRYPEEWLWLHRRWKTFE
ncbi:MAG: lipid A biosynthesis lauroyl acyltransferase [Bdellovibrionaceae bacterium]|nr:lipid A biosynthesis lauroyl acyltransferase [Pseudobdellovibrionaceae bacterium]MBX3035073.1 lipid A biosynthesis lauroyl acyltransferase [Pseudobdellovibrionaceae bacterium]